MNSSPAERHTASHEAVYWLIRAMPRGELVKHGESKCPHRHAPEPGTRTKRVPIVGMTPISERDVGALERRVPGHREGNFIVG